MEVRDHWSIADGARIAGVHYYGPYFAEDKVGCHSVEGRRDPDAKEYERFLDLGIIRIATCAAELAGASEFYRAARTPRVPRYVRPLELYMDRDGTGARGRCAAC